MKKLIPFVIIILLILVIKGNISAIIDTKNNTNTAANLVNKLKTERKENQFLKERLTYVKTNDFIEDEATNKLGLLKPGEHFIIAPTPAPVGKPNEVIDDSPNWQKWWNLFF